jgi:hypothetical protein
MAADLHIHVMEGVTEEDLRCFNAHTIGSKYFNTFRGVCDANYDCRHWRAIIDSAQIWVGSVSWLKAMLLEDTETYVPDVVGKISALIGENEPVIDDDLIAKVREAFESTNDTSYSIANVNDVIAFLEVHRGKKAFTVSW